MSSEVLRVVNSHRTCSGNILYTVHGSAADSVIQEVLYHIHRGELNDQSPNDYILKSVCKDCGKYSVPQCFHSWPLYCHAAFMSFDLLQYTGASSNDRNRCDNAKEFPSWRSDQVLSLSVRDACYRQLFSELAVDGLTRVLLDCRGLNPESLLGGELLCTWPRFVLSNRFPAHLPLNGVHGLSLPALTPQLQIEGVQIKPINATKEKRYHTVGSKLGTTQPSYCLKNGDTPVYTWIPKTISIPSDGIFRIGICEGGLKPAIAAQILHQVFFGSFNRLFSTYTLLRFIADVERDHLRSEVGRSQIVIYIDSGTTSNGPVCADVLHIVSALLSNDYTVRIGWWGQDKSGCNNLSQMDIDDLLIHYPFSYPELISEITVRQFYELFTPDVQTYVKNHGFSIKELKKKPLDITLNYDRVYEDDAMTAPPPEEDNGATPVSDPDRILSDERELRHWSVLQLEDLLSVLR